MKNNKCWSGYGEPRTFIHSLLVEMDICTATVEIVWWFFTKLSLELHYDPEILLLRGVCVCVCVCVKENL